MGMVEDMLKAVKAGDLNAVKALLVENQALVNAADDEGNSAILIATYWGKREVAETLLAHNPQMSVFEASAAGQLNRVKQWLEGQPALIHAWSHDGFTPLHLAAFFGRRDVAEFLLARNPDVNAVTRNPIKVTPLHSAAAGNHYEICAALIAHGADVNARQEGGFTRCTALHKTATWNWSICCCSTAQTRMRRPMRTRPHATLPLKAVTPAWPCACRSDAVHSVKA